jgi:hypothetical protein
MKEIEIIQKAEIVINNHYDTIFYQSDNNSRKDLTTAQT